MSPDTAKPHMTTEHVAKTPDMVAKFVAILRYTAMRDLIANLDSQVDRISIAGRAYPVTISGRVTYLCRSRCSFKPPSVQKRPGFSSPVLSGVVADYRSR